MVSPIERQVFPDSYISWEKSAGQVPEKEEDRDRYFMQYALHIAQCGRGGVNPNPLVGALIVRDGEIIARGYHQQCGQGHAEVNAFQNAKEAGVDVRGAHMYVTLEPCSHYGKTPPCADRIIQEGIGRVVVAMLDPNPKVAGQGIERLRQAGISVKTGVLEEQARRLNEVFLKYITTKRPFVFLKMAMSLDGKIATRTGQSQWISGEQSRTQVHVLRNHFPAVMVGIGTVLADDPMLNCRMGNVVRQPIRIVADTRLRIPLDSKLVQTSEEYRTVIAVGESTVEKPDFERTQKIQVLKAAGAEIFSVPERDGKLDLPVLMKLLGGLGIDGILLEGGANLAYAALYSGVVDKVRIYIAPKIIGGQQARGCIGGEGIEDLSNAIALSGMKAYSCGEDIFLEGMVVNPCLQGL